MAYSGAVITSLSVALSLRMLTKGMVRNSKGTTFIMFNTLIAVMANCSANYINTKIIRYPESLTGIKVFKTKHTQKEEDFIGYSQICANQAIDQTANTRIVLSLLASSVPTLLAIPI